ncbi:helix-turn-helix domain-containing protein [Mycobacteroides abscessus]|uniref:AlbA family DNA-binding domain-containing protein n=1 Tax=Mycobacteroides abscessus TaxID=36809 RepID=UPI0012FFD5E3|nr:hypothetical protein [Mycobacteroides abscessus]
MGTQPDRVHRREPRRIINLGKGEAVARYNDIDFEINIDAIAHLTLPELTKELTREGDKGIFLTIWYSEDELFNAYPNSNLLIDSGGLIFVKLERGESQILLSSKIAGGRYRESKGRNEAIEAAQRVAQSYGFEVVSTKSYADELELSLRPTPEATLLQAAHLQSVIADCTRIVSPHSPVSIVQAVLNGQAERLIGVHESNCLDAKLKHYDRRNDLSRFQFACDVAAFANSSTGGLILIGAQVKKVRGADIISSIPGCKSEPGSRQAYQSIVDQHIAPEISGLSYHVSHHRNDREMFMIFVPPQPPSTLPFIVKGGIFSNGKYTASMFSIPIRQQDCNVSTRLIDVQRYIAELKPKSAASAPSTPSDG